MRVYVCTILHYDSNLWLYQKILLSLFFEKYLIKGSPIKKMIISDVITESPILKVIYLNTFRKEKVSTKDVRKL